MTTLVSLIQLHEQAIVIVDILSCRGFNKLSGTGDKIDPYIKVRINGCEDGFQTEIKFDQGKPQYNQRFVFRLPVGCEADHVNLKLMDQDGASSDDHKASGSVPFPDPLCAFSGNVALDEDKANEEANPVVTCSIVYLPFAEAFKAENVLDKLVGQVAALEEDDAADEAERVRLQAQLEAMAADDEADEAAKAALAERVSG